MGSLYVAECLQWSTAKDIFRAGMSCALAGKQSRRVRLYFRSEEKEAHRSGVILEDRVCMTVFHSVSPSFLNCYSATLKFSGTQMQTLSLLCLPACKHSFAASSLT
mmetsp:Transcript_1753/g.3715  ORF Transcript_1753/g.3715 Transcript_1753/m.3715 type:complete len:106 (-) Transcript_1753:116-433(-)